MFNICTINHTLLFPSLRHGLYRMRDHKDRFVLCLYEYLFYFALSKCMMIKRHYVISYYVVFLDFWWFSLECQL